MATVKIYTTPTCHYCKMAKEYFQSKSIQYEEYNVMTNLEKRQEMISKTGQMGVPIIDIGGKIIIGFDRSKINEYLEL